MGSEKFCLRWNDFESNISTAFRELRDDKDFFDVTLACEDEQIQAHKVILSACSQFFRNILRRNSHQHPLLYLKGVRFPDLQAVLNFMYHGEVNVAQEELNSFLSVAEDLRVKGLTQSQSGPSHKESYSLPKSPALRKPETPLSERREPDQIIKRPKLNPALHKNSQGSIDNDEIQEVVSVKTEPRDTQPPPPPQQTHPVAAPAEQFYVPQESQALAPASDQLVDYQDGSYEDYGEYSGELQGYDGAMLGGQDGDGNKDGSLDAKIEALVSKTSTGELQCMICGKSSTVRQNIRNHIETHVASDGFYCDLCGKLFKTRNSRSVHKSLHHKNSAKEGNIYQM